MNNWTFLFPAFILLFISNSFSQSREIIVFSSDRTGNSGIYQMYADGTGLKAVVDGPFNEWSPKLDPKGKFITYLADEGGVFVRYQIKLNGKGKKILPHPENFTLNDRNAHISPNGKWLLYDNEGPNGSDIFICKRDGTDPRNLTRTSGKRDYKPFWAPDGSHIVFTSNRDGNLEIYRMDLDGENLLNLTNNPADDEQPIYSPDGERIVFRSSREGNDNQELFVMNNIGMGLRKVTNTPSWELLAGWVGNNTLIFGSNRDGNWELYRQNLDGTGLKRLTNNTGFDGDPHWLK